MRNMTIGLMAAFALVLGLAAPASADPVGVLATGTFRDALAAPTGSVVNGANCLVVPDTTVTVDVSSGTVTLYLDSGCTALLQYNAVTAPNSGVALGGTFYKA